jgi:hypothetical protein
MRTLVDAVAVARGAAGTIVRMRTTP